MPGPTAKLADRYGFVQSIQSGAKTVAWLAEDDQSKRRVVASAIGVARLSALTSIVGVQHPHLTTVLDVIVNPDPLQIPSERGPVKAPAVAIAEHVAGITLHDQLKTGRLSERHAVDLVVRIGLSLAVLHEKGGAHGAVSPRSIVVIPSDGRSPPVLTQLVAPTSGAYSSPERLRGAPPSSTDDSWALHATLYAALTGSAPFAGSTKEDLVKAMLLPTRRLDELGIDEPNLQLVIDTGLARQPIKRLAVSELVTALESWLEAREASAHKSLADSDDEETQLMHGFPASAPWPDLADARSEKDTAAVAPYEPVGTAPAPPPFADLHDEATSVMSTEALAPLIDAQQRNVEAASPAALDKLEPEADAEPPPQRLPSKKPPPPPKPLVVGADGDAPFPFGSPLGESASPEPSVRSAMAADAGPSRVLPERRSRAWAYAVPLAAVVVVGGAVLGFLFYENSKRKSAPVAVATPAAPPAAATVVEPIADAAAVATTAPALDTASPPAKPPTTAECVAAHFPPDTFRGLGPEEATSFDFLCNSDDLRALSSHLHRKIVLGGAGRISDGMKAWSSLGWFELPATAVARRACCPGASTVLPANQGPCKQLTEVVDDVSSRPIHEADAPTRAAVFSEAVHCFFYYGVKRPYRYKGYPQKNQEESFAELLRRAARVPASALPSAPHGAAPLVQTSADAGAE